MRPSFSPRLPPLAIVLAVAILTVLVAACGGGDDNSRQGTTGKLTDPGSVPTASPWASPPQIVILDPNALTPIGGGATPNSGNGGATEPTPVPGHCGPKYKVVSGDYPGLIAQKCGITTEALLQANPGLDPTALHIGDTLNIPE